MPWQPTEDTIREAHRDHVEKDMLEFDFLRKYRRKPYEFRPHWVRLGLVPTRLEWLRQQRQARKTRAA